MKTLQILGMGYTGKKLKTHLLKRDPKINVHGTRRDLFDLHKRETWKNIVTADTTFWLFPAESTELIEDFLKMMDGRLGKLIVVGSTSGFKINDKDQKITEDSPLNLEITRVQGEELIRKSGGIVVRAAGIYGALRNPRSWLRHGRIIAGASFLNLIHVDDLVQILDRAHESGAASAHYIAADGKPYRWFELSDRWVDIPLTAQFDRDLEKADSKIVDPSWTLKTLNVTLRYPSVFEGIESLYE